MKGREEGEERGGEEEEKGDRGGGGGGERDRERDILTPVSAVQVILGRQTDRHKVRPSVSQMQRDGKGKRGAVVCYQQMSQPREPPEAPDLLQPRYIFPNVLHHSDITDQKRHSLLGAELAPTTKLRHSCSELPFPLYKMLPLDMLYRRL